MFLFQLVQQWWQKLLESLLWIPLLCRSKLSGIRDQRVCPEPSCLRSISASLLQFTHHKPTQRMESGTLKRLRTSFSTQCCLFCYLKAQDCLKKRQSNSVIYTVNTSCLIQLRSGKLTVNEPNYANSVLKNMHTVSRKPMISVLVSSSSHSVQYNLVTYLIERLVTDTENQWLPHSRIWGLGMLLECCKNH